MSHGVHAVQHEVEHELKHGDQHGRHGGLLDNINKKIALLIGVLALLLAFSETLGKSAQTGAISYNIEAANLWAFFQAKNIRRTVVLTAAEEMTVDTPASPEIIKAAAIKQIDSWGKTAARYRSSLNSGRNHGAERSGPAAEMERDTAMAKHHHYEVRQPASRSVSCSRPQPDHGHDAAHVACRLGSAASALCRP